ncbi:hypothetical protein V493_06973 [Pseudogymnoascus sp. VKM F-4281 (FW-2241)]|nr:hypothetical protein V493_06973 [Pseudogymnoascus sp. VKM F-4281 (FW-2241)]
MSATASETAGVYPSTVADQALLDAPDAQQLIIDYVTARSPEYRQLHNLRSQASSPHCRSITHDVHNGREQADSPSQEGLRHFYNMTIAIGTELNNRTKAFHVLHTSEKPSALDMGMAPGGFSKTILDKYPKASVRAITLPNTDGGHAIQLDDANLKLELRDINTLAGDLGLSSVPETHPGAETLTLEKLLGEELYDVAICGCQVTRTQQREQWREHRESRRLQLAQLVIAMEHLKDNGTLIAVLHKPESFDTAEILRLFSGFSNITLFKPVKAHAKRSSFYMVAKKVRPLMAVRTIEAWKEEWRIATLGSHNEYEILTRRSAEDTQMILEQFGEELVKLGRLVWVTQAKALEKAPFITNTALGGYS